MSAKIIKSTDGNAFDFGGLGVHRKLDGAPTGGHFTVVHHPIDPRALAAPLHRHQNEDEYSYVLKGTLGALLGDDVLSAGRAPAWSNPGINGTLFGTRENSRAKSLK